LQAAEKANVLVFASAAKQSRRYFRPKAHRLRTLKRGLWFASLLCSSQ
jgi:hypothetical protein